ncbi:hypothetical protein HNY73_009621 [Argiope bruennichi]|uniref:Uncharacterized protein n=1 Tax=Argiope bruennichi TaxID=94029 RepID=A0A8T0FA78_ARGBR|nr:hypothetical protein HNY73_009621 [Argiope bruennichi]
MGLRSVPSVLRGRKDGGQSKNVASRIPKFTFDPERCYDASRHHGDRNGAHLRTNLEGDKLYGYRRIPTPMPRGRTPPGGDVARMSRPNRVGPPTSSASTSTSATGSGGTGIPVPVVQQAQQYLEENIKQWMEPTPPPQSRET